MKDDAIDLFAPRRWDLVSMKTDEFKFLLLEPVRRLQHLPSALHPDLGGGPTPHGGGWSPQGVEGDVGMAWLGLFL